jgi:hypothetical protein
VGCLEEVETDAGPIDGREMEPVKGLELFHTEIGTEKEEEGKVRNGK